MRASNWAVSQQGWHSRQNLVTTMPVFWVCVVRHVEVVEEHTS